MTLNNPLESIYFITFPEDTVLSKDAFQIDTTIPLPVQKKITKHQDSSTQMKLHKNKFLQEF